MTSPSPLEPHRKRYVAMTLIELLIAIAVIATLLLVVMKGGSSLKTMGQAARCLANLRQSGVALRAYSVDHGGIIVLHDYSARHSPTSMRWIDYLTYRRNAANTGFVQDRALLATYQNIALCPGAPPFRFLANGYVYGTLGMATQDDPYDFTPPGDQNSGRAVRLHAIDEPSTYWLLVDSYHPTLMDGKSAQSYIIRDDDTQRGKAHLRHSSKAHFLFADGHAKGLTIREIGNLRFNPMQSAYDNQGKTIHF